MGERGCNRERGCVREMVRKRDGSKRKVIQNN